MTIANESGGEVPCRFCGVPWDRAKFSKCDCGAALDCYGNEQVGPVTYRTPEEWAKDIPQEDGAREGVARWTAETEWSHEGQCDVTKVLEDPHGEFVKHEDHLAELSRLKAERDAALGRYADAVREGDRLRAECAGLRELLSEARDSVEFEVQEKRQNWGDRLMHKQQGAIDLLARLDAFLGDGGGRS